MDCSVASRRCIVTVLAVLAVLVSAGCGGNTASTGSTTSAASHKTPAVATSAAAKSRDGARLIARADAICRRLNSQVIASGGPHTAEEIVRLVPKNAALERMANADLQRLGPPPALGRGWRAFLSFRRKLVTELDALVAAKRRNDARAAQIATTAKGILHGLMGSTATHLGVRDCAHIG
jgi:hypothetical protein